MRSGATPESRQLSQNRTETSFVAQYKRVEGELRKQIRSGRWNAGVMLPSHRDLAREYDVSSGTIRRAVDTLVTEGLLHADSRRGTFAAHTAEPEQGGDTAAPPDPGRPLVVGIVAAVDEGQVPPVLHSLERALSEGGHVTTVRSRVRGEGEALLPLDESIAALLRDGVDALAVICLELDRVRIEEALGRVDLRDVPAVCLLAGGLHLPIPHVFYDNRIGGYQAAQHLLDKGHRKITVFAPFTASWVTERLAGIRSALAHPRQTAAEAEFVMGDGRAWDYLNDPTEIGSETARAALASGWTPQGGIVCINDQVAYGVSLAAVQYGYRVGEDFALIGFDDNKCARVGGLTTLRPPLEEMGREAARLLIDEARGSRVSLQLRLRAHLITRASTNFLPGPAAPRTRLTAPAPSGELVSR